jgi:hypothetical protein
MVTYEDLAAFYGVDHVHRCSIEGLLGLTLPNEARLMLSQVGLPDRGCANFTSYLSECVNGLPVFNPARRPGPWYRLGTSALAEICLNGRTGEVWKLWPTGQHVDTFVNSSVTAFTEFQYLFDRLCQQDTGESDEGMRRATQEMEEQWRQVDPRALVDEDFFWPQWLDDTKLQLSVSPYADTSGS